MTDTRLNEALALHQQGFFDQAEAIYQEILRTQAQNFDALQLLATIAAQRKNSVLAVELFDRALAINPQHPGSLNNRGNALLDLHRAAEALDSYDQVLQLQPEHVEAGNNRGSALRQLKRYSEALAAFDRVLAIKPDYPEAIINRGKTLRDLQRPVEALACYEQALRIRPQHADTLNSRAIVLRDLQRHEEALASCEQALQSRPDYAEALINKGTILLELLRDEEALECYEYALKRLPDSAEGLNNRGVALNRLNRPQEALESHDRALAIRPDYAEALNNRGATLVDLKRPAEALSSFDRALEIDPAHVMALYNRGNALNNLGRHQEALDSFARVLARQPEHVEALKSRGNTLADLKRYPEALACYGQALQIRPDHPYLLGTWLFAKLKVCDWSELEAASRLLLEKINRQETASTPFPVFSLSASRSAQRKAAEIWVQSKFPVRHTLPPIGLLPRHDKIRLAYFSADFYNHATAYLMAGLLERHDRSRFELTAFSFGPAKNDEMRSRIAAAFDHFIDVRDQSDREIALLARSLEIDIAVDLKGYTQDSRAGIFLLRAAPLQVSYVGYPGSMCCETIYYLIAYASLIPEHLRKDYSETIAYLPHSYQVNDASRRIAARDFSRAEMGLPPKGFVFCCFNNNYKINPDVFACWMRLLSAVEGSVLWLFESNPLAADKLRRAAALHGVTPERLVFARNMPLAEHLARHRLADLFLDTTPCNAHTTASDALWAGLPLLTCQGETFAGRVAASLLNAIKLPELITATPEDYEALAIELAHNPDRLDSIRTKLIDNRFTTPLFDTGLFTRHIEAAYAAMYERYQSGLAPEPIVVAPGIVR